jgi:hypothetical protein
MSQSVMQGGGLIFVKHEFAKDKQERLAAGKPETRESSH